MIFEGTEYLYRISSPKLEVGAVVTGPRSHSVAEVGLEVIWQGVRVLGMLGGPSVRERGHGLPEALENGDVVCLETAGLGGDRERNGSQPLVPCSPPDPGRAEGGTEAASDTTRACKPKAGVKVLSDTTPHP